MKRTQQKFNCKDCSFVFENRSDLNNHKSQKHIKSEVECEMCGIFFISQEEFNEHKKEKHSDHDEKGSNDEEIIALTKLLENLVDKKPAIENSEENTPLKCDQCKNSFGTKRSLSVHIRRKHQIAQESSSLPEYKCGFCVINFDSIDQMDSHMDDHHGGRWKMYDDDVILEGEDYMESSSDCTETDTSETENSESQSGEE